MGVVPFIFLGTIENGNVPGNLSLRKSIIDVKSRGSTNKISILPISPKDGFFFLPTKTYINYSCNCSTGARE